jgi:hypothetical protein
MEALVRETRDGSYVVEASKDLLPSSVYLPTFLPSYFSIFLFSYFPAFLLSYFPDFLTSCLPDFLRAYPPSYSQHQPSASRRCSVPLVLVTHYTSQRPSLALRALGITDQEPKHRKLYLLSWKLPRFSLRRRRPPCPALPM